MSNLVLGSAIFVLGLLLIWAAAFVLANRRRKITDAQTAAYRRGDYRTMLEVTEKLKSKWSEPALYLFFHGVGCYHLGWLRDAEENARRSIAKGNNPRLRAIANSALGKILMEQGRWDEAAKCVAESSKLWPRKGDWLRDTAELRLRQGVDRAGALDPARQAVALHREAVAKSRQPVPVAHTANLSESLAVLGWALAENRGDRSEIESSLNEAIAICGNEHVPVFAEIRYFAGRAYAALRDHAAAARMFQAAAAKDAVGNYGRLCRSVLTHAA